MKCKIELKAAKKHEPKQSMIQYSLFMYDIFLFFCKRHWCFWRVQAVFTVWLFPQLIPSNRISSFVGTFQAILPCDFPVIDGTLGCLSTKRIGMMQSFFRRFLRSLTLQLHPLCFVVCGQMPVQRIQHKPTEPAMESWWRWKEGFLWK